MAVGCALPTEDVNRYLDDKTRTWTLDDAAMGALKNDVQAVINCTRKGDTILFDVSQSIQPSERFTLPWVLTLSAATDDDPVAGIFEEAANKTTFRCPSESEGVFLVSSKGALFANIAFETCNLDVEDGGAAIVEVETCEGEETGDLQMHHVRYSKNRLNFAQMLLVNTPSCSVVEMVDVAFDRNVCDGGFCGIELSTNNDLKEVVLRKNDFSEASKDRPPAIFHAPAGSTTSIDKMIAAENEATAIHVENGELRIRDSRFARNSVETEEGRVFSACLHLINATAVVRRCRFRENRARSGAAVSAAGSNITVTSSEFSSNEVSDGGAGMLLVNGTLAKVTECRFDGNDAGVSGGGIRCVNASLTVMDTGFVNNIAGRGAGIYVEGDRLNIERCRFQGNAATVEAGGIRFVGDDCRLKSVVLVKNKAEVAGGAAFIENGTLATISNLTCEDNAARNGGCLHVQATPLNIEDTVIRGNNASISAGGLSIRNTTIANISSTVFETNSAGEDGGGLYLFANNVTIVRETPFRNNNASANGGGIYAEQVNEVVLDSITLIESSAGNRGGGIYCVKGTGLKISSSLFIENQGLFGGASIFVGSSSKGNFTNTTWIGNNPEGDIEASCILIDDSSMQIDNGLFENNKAATGAAIHVNKGNIDVVNSRFHNNLPSLYGTVSGSGGANGTFKDCTFTNNHASNGAVMGVTEGSHFTFERSYLFNNSANSGGCLFNYQAKSTFLDSTFENNTAEESGGCFFGHQGEITLERVRVTGNGAANTGGALWMLGSTVRISTTLLTNNEVGHAGGALRIYGGQLWMSNVTIQHCKSGGEGGALALSSDSSAVIENSTIAHNEALLDGGGVYVVTNSNLTARDLKIVHNEAGGIGGGIFGKESCNLSLVDTMIAFNRAQDGGGAGCSVATLATLENSNFLNNSARFGGDSYISLNSTLKLINCRAQYSRAESGGSVFGSNSTLTMVDTEFRIETASGKGGAVATTNGSVISVEDVVMVGNSAQMGGALYFGETSFEGRSLRVLSNRGQDGGGVLAEISSTVLCAECSFENNTAEREGGGVALDANDTQSLAFQFDNCIFSGNNATFGSKDHSLFFCISMVTGGIHFVTPSSRVDCTDLRGNCTYLALRGAVLTGNEASSSGGAVLASDLNTVRLDCAKLNPKEVLSFLTLDQLEKLNVLNSLNTVCPSWERNKAEEFGSILASYGRGMNVTVLYEGTGSTETVVGESFFLPNHQSGSPLPTFFLTVVDGLGQGPVPGRDSRYIEATLSSNVLFTGVLSAQLKNGTAEFSGISGFAVPGLSKVRIDYNDPSIPPFIIAVEIRKCTIGEFTAQNGTLCQRCPGGTFNFHPDRTNISCLPCTEGGNCDDEVPISKSGHWHSSPCSSSVQKCLTDRACNDVDREERLKNITANVTDCAAATEELLANYSKAQCRKGYEGVLCGTCSDTHGRVGSSRCERCLGKMRSVVPVVLQLVLLMTFSVIAIRGGLPSHRKPTTPLASQQPSPPNQEHKDGPSGEFEMVQLSIPGNHLEEINAASPTKSFIEDTHPTNSPVEEAVTGDEADLAKWKITEIFKARDPNLLSYSNLCVFQITINFLQDTAVALAINVEWTDSLVNMFKVEELLGLVAAEAATGSVDCLISADSIVPRSAMRSLLVILIPMIAGVIFVLMWSLYTLRSKASWVYLIKRCMLSTLVVSYLSYITITKTAVNTLYCVDVHDSTEVSSDHVTRYWAWDTRLECHEGAHAVLEATIGWPVLAPFSLGFPLMMAIIFLCLKNRLGIQNAWLFESAGFLYRAYRNEYIYWESIVMLRKAALAVVVVFAYPLGGGIQGILGVYILMIALYIHIICLPFRKEFASLNIFEGLSLFLSSLTFASGFFFADGATSETTRALISVLLILTNTGMLVIFFVITLRYAMEYLRLTVESDNHPHDPPVSDFQIIKIFLGSSFGKLYGYCRENKMASCFGMYKCRTQNKTDSCFGKLFGWWTENKTDDQTGDLASQLHISV